MGSNNQPNNSISYSPKRHVMRQNVLSDLKKFVKQYFHFFVRTIKWLVAMVEKFK